MVFLATISLAIAWLLTTNSGLNAALKVAGQLSPLEVRYAEAKGKIIGAPITLRNVVASKNEYVFTIEQIEIDWQFGTLRAFKVLGLEYFLPANQALATGKHSEIARIDARLERLANAKVYCANMRGIWQEQPLVLNLKATEKNGNLLVNNAILKLGQI